MAGLEELEADLELSQVDSVRSDCCYLDHNGLTNSEDPHLIWSDVREKDHEEVKKTFVKVVPYDNFLRGAWT